jgi:hypothetical protein
MQKNTLTARFLSGFEPIVLPPRGPDGMIPSGPARMSLPVLPPTLCEAGPCAHYHRVSSVMEDQEPIGGPGPIRRMVTRACYPAPGVEIELDSPVLQCSRWEPNGEQERLDGIRKRFLSSEPGKAFSGQVSEFEASHEQARDTEVTEVASKQADEFKADAEARAEGSVIP